MDDKVMYKLTYGLFVATARQGDVDNGCITNTAIQIASVPNQVSIALNKGSYTHDMIKATGEFNVSVISEKATFGLFKRFGFQSGRNVEKFHNYSGKARGNNGIYYITEGTNAYISVKVTKMEDLGSHTMFIGTVTDMEVLSDDNSMTYGYYQEHVKPKRVPADAIPDATSDRIPDEEATKNYGKGKVTNMRFFKCSVCGNFVEMVKGSGAPMTCCGQEMTELIPGTSDGAHEKHVPVCKIDGNKVTVNVGEKDHPMLDEHLIEWVAIETNKGIHRIILKPGCAPKAVFMLGDGETVVGVYSYCNLHGLWKAENC